MSLPRTKLWPVLWALTFLAAAPASAQGLRDAQLFAPAENDHFGEGARASEGAFFQFDGLYWWISAPDADDIGKKGASRDAVLRREYPPGTEPPIQMYTPVNVTQHNTHDTSDLTAAGVGGTRFEFGYVHEHDGIIFTLTNLQEQNQHLYYGPSDVVIDDLPTSFADQGRLVGYFAWLINMGQPGTYLVDPSYLVKLPIRFDELRIKNSTKYWGFETQYLYRTHAGPHAGLWELFLGARYLQFDDYFQVEGHGDKFVRVFAEGEEPEEGQDPDALGDPYEPGTILADSTWYSSAQNHIIGPQIGLRLFQKTERWTWESQVRFFAGLNIQNLRQGGDLGSELDNPTFFDSTEGDFPGATPFQPLYMRHETFNHNRTAYEWSPGVELRLDLKYQVTNSVDLRVGWSGLWMDGIARASNIIDYTFYESQFMGVDLKDNRQGVFMHGVTFGVDINR